MLSSFRSKIGNVFLPIYLWAFSNDVCGWPFLDMNNTTANAKRAWPVEVSVFHIQTVQGAQPGIELCTILQASQSLFRLKYYKWWEALWVPNRLVVPLMKGTGCPGKTRNTQGWLMIAPCSSGVIRDQKQRENRIETNDFFPPACLACLASTSLLQQLTAA